MLRGTMNVPGDKSITHRALLLLSFAKGTSTITNFLASDDTRATLAIMRALGVQIDLKGSKVVIHGVNSVFKPCHETLDCQNSGTTARLLLGLLSGQKHTYTIIGDDSLSQRPMKRVYDPLRTLGASLALTNNNYLPITIHPSQLYAQSIHLTVPSAQVKSAVILASLQINEPTTIVEFGSSRNHTELMLRYLGADIVCLDGTITISGKKPLIGQDIMIPGDISSAAFFIIGCLLSKGSKLTIENCGINPTRLGLIKVLLAMGANITFSNHKLYGFEPVADITVHYTENLTPFVIDEHIMPQLIDEIPILSLLATQVEGVSVIKGAAELRIKETDRLNAVRKELNKLGASITEHSDGLTIHGKSHLTNKQSVSSYNDHRMSMMLKIAELITGPLSIDNRLCDRVSYPNFEQDLLKLKK